MSFLTVPPPHDDDHEDVAWALRAASAQWQRDAHEDAIQWVKRASETAKEIGSAGRAQELSRLAIALSNASMPAIAPPPRVSAMAPPPPPGAVAPPPPAGSGAFRGSAPSIVDVEIEEVDFEFDEVEELDDDDDIELLDEEGIVEIGAGFPSPQQLAQASGFASSRPPVPLPPVPPPSLPPSASRAPSSRDFDAEEATTRGESRNHSEPPSVRAPAPSEAPDFGPGPPDSARPSSTQAPRSRRGSSRAKARRARTSRTPSRAPEAPVEASGSVPEHSRAATPSSPRKSRTGRTTTSPKLDRLPPSMRPEPSGLDLDEEAEDELFSTESSRSEEYGELQFGDEAATRRRDPDEPPPIPDLGPLPMEGSSVLPILDQTAAEYAQTRANLDHDHEALERELGVDLSVRGVRRPSQAPRKVDVPESDPSPRISSYPSSAPPGAIGSTADSQIPELDTTSRSPVPGRASFRPSEHARAAAPRTTSAAVEPYGLAPSAKLPPIATPSDLPPIEPPSSPTQAPPPSSMAEPAQHDSSLPPPPMEPRYQEIPPASAAPNAEEFEELFSKISMPPVAPTSRATSEADDASTKDRASDSTREGARNSVPAQPLLGDDGAVLVDGLDLMQVEGFQDLPEDSALELAERAELRTLAKDEEITGFGLAIVTHGAVTLMPSVTDAACRVATKGQVLFTQGTLDNSAVVRVVGLEEGSRVAVFEKADLDRAVSSCPWVGDELAEVADAHSAFAGAVMGLLGNSLDEVFRFMVLEKCTAKRRQPGDVIAQGGKAMDGMYILGGGSLEIVDTNGSLLSMLSMGDFVFPETVLSAAPAEHTVRAGAGGALVLYAPRMAAHELLATCPPFIELLAR